MMNASEKESMNSNKSDVIYEVYTKSLENEQMPFEIQVNKFNRKYFNYTGVCNIETPIFSDKKEIEVDLILKLFNNGMLTIGQSINAISILYPHLDMNVDEENPLYQDRFYNGNLLGIEPNTDDLNSFDDVRDLIAYLDEN